MFTYKHQIPIFIKYYVSFSLNLKKEACLIKKKKNHTVSEIFVCAEMWSGIIRNDDLFFLHVNTFISDPSTVICPITEI